MRSSANCARPRSHLRRDTLRLATPVDRKFPTVVIDDSPGGHPEQPEQPVVDSAERISEPTYLTDEQLLDFFENDIDKFGSFEDFEDLPELAELDDALPPAPDNTMGVDEPGGDEGAADADHAFFQEQLQLQNAAVAPAPKRRRVTQHSILNLKTIRNSSCTVVQKVQVELKQIGSPISLRLEATFHDNL